MTDKLEVLIHRALDNFNIELPSWGFANTGTRFGKFIQMAAAVSIEEKFSDAGPSARLNRLLSDGRFACAVGSSQRFERCRPGGAIGGEIRSAAGID